MRLSPILGLVLGLTPITACGFGVEHICAGDEIVVVPGRAYGDYCVKRKPGDQECPDGERLRRVFNPPREDCIQDEVGHVYDDLPPPEPEPSANPYSS
jgi:hypothetical protein